jgi:outer membrane protein assembly factor BamB
VSLQWLLWIVLPLLGVIDGGTAIVGGLAAGLIVLIWWLLFSRAPWLDRFGAIVVMVAAVAAAYGIVHPSIANAFMGRMLPVFSIPLLCLGLVASAAAGRRLSIGRRRAVMAGSIVLAVATMALVRTGGITGEATSDIHWRWSKTPEQRLLEQPSDEPAAPPAAPDVVPTPAAAANAAAPAASPAGTPRADAPAAGATPRDARAEAPVTAAAATPPKPAADAIRAAAWPGFRGAARDGVVRGVRIETDWSRRPPAELWRRKIGPGWSSFAVLGDLIYTQEQRGEDEIVSAHSLKTGQPVWRHRDPARFYESNGGTGPRATPTVSGGRVYTLGATGIVNALDARTGARIWSRNAASDTQKEVPDWGLAGSPLVIGDTVVLAVAGRLVAYDANSGEQRWLGPAGGGGYSSPHLATIGGVPQILLTRGARTLSVKPADGSQLWEQSTGQPVTSILQPAVTPEGDVLVASGDAMGGTGIRRLTVAHADGSWTVQERWASRGLKPYFNDFVVHKGHAYGFDGSILACIELAGGERKWKGGRYGHGQLLLFPDQDVLLVLSEDGELALVKAAPDQFTELARAPAMHAKTWNHPVLVGDMLLVRNGEEMVAFRLAISN